MSTDTASWIFVAIMSTGVFVWTWSLTKARRLGLAPKQVDRWPDEGGLEFETETGEVTVRGEPEKLGKALVRSLRQSVLSMMGASFRVTEQTPERLTFEKVGAIVCNQPAGLYFTEADLSFLPLGDGTVQVSYCLGYERLVHLLRKIALSIIWGVGLPVMLIVGNLIWYFVVQSNDPSVRWQVFQTLQIAHALWPPFMFIAIYRMGRRQSKIFIENLITSVEELD